MLNEKEYYVYLNNNNQSMIEEILILQDHNSANTLASEGIEKLHNVMNVDKGSVTLNRWGNMSDDPITYYISIDGSDVDVESLWITQEKVNILIGAKEAAKEAMKNGETIVEKYEA